ncbi:MAG: hypothetical protein ACRD35_00145 [Candidatus Acidiferrales bacterium]
MRVFLGFTALLLLPNLAAPATPPFQPLPEEQKLCLREAFHLAQLLGPVVWPSFDGHDVPVLLIMGETEYLLNRNEAPSGFIAVQGDQFKQRPVFARPRVFPPNLQASFPAIGTETVVVGTAEQSGLSPAAWVLIVTHEFFHVFQAAHGLNAKIMALAIGAPEDSDWHLNFPFPYDDADVSTALHLLGDALYRAVAKGEPNLSPAKTAQEALSNLIRVLELTTNDPRHANYLRYQTGKEGVARYVEYRLAERASHSDYQPLPEFTTLPGVKPYAAVWNESYASQLEQLWDVGRVNRKRVDFYCLGQGLALLLDRFDARWKSRYFEPGVWLDDLMKGAVSGR